MLKADEAKEIADKSYKAYGRIFEVLDDLVRRAARRGDYEAYFYKDTLYSSDNITKRAFEVLEKIGYKIESIDGERYTISWK